MFGALPSRPDIRDEEYRIACFTDVKKEFPSSYFLGDEFHVYNQAWSNMCVAFSLAQVCEVFRRRECGDYVRLSPKWIYGNREDGYMGEGMEIRDALKGVKRDGVALWDSFPGIGSFYSVYSEVMSRKKDYLTEARQHAILTYSRLYSDEEIKTALMEYGPVLACVKVSDSFVYGDVYKRNFAGVSKGYHAILLVGWCECDGEEYWKFLNSWGDTWGEKGYAYLLVGSDALVESWSVLDMIGCGGGGVNGD